MSNLFLRLLNISITAGWIVLVVVLLRFVLKKAPKWTRVVLWGLVALRLLLPVSIESPLSLVPSEQTVSIATWTLPDTAVGTSEEGSAAQRTTAERVVFQTGFPALNSAINPTMKQSYEHHSTVSTVKVVAGWVWLAGVVGMLFYALISFLRLKHRVRASVLLEKGVYVCDEISDPFILGLIVPKIYLPSGMDEQTRAYVLAHERAHLKRFDHIWKPLGFLQLSVYWFNPLLWLAYILLCRDIELACDEKVVKEYDAENKAAYSEALLKSSVSRRSIAACPLAFGEVGVKSRVKSILNYKKPAFWIILVALLAGVVVAVCFLTMPKKDKTVSLSYEDNPVLWFDSRDSGNDPEEGSAPVSLSAFPDVTFRCERNPSWGNSVLAVENGKTRTLFSGMPIWNVFFADMTGDGKPELCASVSFGSGIVDDHIVVYDYVNRQSYTLWDRMQFDFHLYTVDDALYVGKTPYMGDKQIDSGTLVMRDGVPGCQWQSDGSFAPLLRELHESELIGEWLVEEERDANDNVIYTRSAELWKEYNFREDGTVVYNETVPVSSDSELAFGHPVEYSYAVYDDHVHIEDGRSCSGYYDPRTRTLELSYQTSPGQYTYATLRRMGEGAQSETTLDEATLCTTWMLAEIEAADGSNGDARALGLEQYLVFRFDGTVRMIDAKEHSDQTVPYTLSGNTVRFGDRTLRYDPALNELFGIDPSSQNVLSYTPAPNASSAYIDELSFTSNYWVCAESTEFIETGSEFGYLQEPINVRRYRDTDGSRLVYELNGMTYKEIVNPDPNGTVYHEYYLWFYDRSFFSFYAQTNIGTLYRNNVVDTLEVLILKDEKGIEHILAAEQSNLLDISKYDAKDFGLLAFSDDTIYQAGQFSWILDIHTGRSIENVAKAEEFHEINAITTINLTWQYIRIPGLRYNFLITTDWITKENYIYSRAERCMYKLLSPLTINE